MNFRLEFTPTSFEKKIQLQDRLFLAGSCFTEQIGQKLSYFKFQTIENPSGILFNPLSIVESIAECIDQKIYTTDDLFFYNELWGSWNHHTRFSSISQQDCIDKINNSINVAHEFLKKTDWVLLTLGSSFVYELDNKRVVANCHKVPTDKFTKRLLSSSEIEAALNGLLEKLLQFNPAIKIILTISPVRHLRDGFVENNRSKSNLIHAVHEVSTKKDAVYYFPSYELVIDDLRDYRFFAEDMVHPNYTATNYVWEKFIDACIEEDTQLVMKEIGIIRNAKNHKPFNPLSQAHQQFKKTNIERAIRLQKGNPNLDFSEEIDFFK